MPYIPINAAQFETKGYGLQGDLLENALKGYEMARKPKQIRQEEQQRDLANRLLGHQGTNEEIKSRYLPREYESNIANKEAMTGLTKEQTEGLSIANRIERLHGERDRLSQIGGREALNEGYRLDNEIKQETGMLHSWLDAQQKNLANKGKSMENDFYPIDKSVDILGKLGTNRAQDFTNEMNEQYTPTQRRQEQDARQLANDSARHVLELQRKYDEALTQLRIAKENGELTAQEYDNEIKRINSEYQARIKELEVRQGEANVGHTEAGTKSLEEGTIGQKIQNEVDRDHKARTAELANQLQEGNISGVEYDNKKKQIDNEYHRDIKKNEVAQGKENVAATKAGTQNVQAATTAQNFKNRLDGKYGEEDKKLAQEQARSSIEQTQAQSTKLWNDIKQELKYGDQTKAAELQALHDQSAANRAKIYKDMYEVHKDEQEYKNVPEGSVPISAFKGKGTQTAILNEQKEMESKINSAEKVMQKLNRLDQILDENPEFGKSWQLALTAPDKEGVIAALAKAWLPGQNEKQLEAAQEFKKLANDIVLDLGVSSLGARFTDTKFRALQASKPYLNNKKKANKAVINHLRKEFEPLIKFKKDFQKGRDKYTVHFDYAKYSDLPLDQLSNEEFDALELAQGLKE